MIRPIVVFPTSICKVCGAGGAQQFYGGQCCPSCRVFFIRTVNRRRPYSCFRGGNCTIITGSKINCKACRFEKCKLSNMVVESVGRRKKEKDHIELPSNLVPYLEKKYESNISEMRIEKKKLDRTLSLGYNFIDILKTKTNPVHFANELVKLEEICDNIHGPMPTSLNFNLNAPLSDVLRYSQQCCERTSVGWNIAIKTESMMDLLHLAYCRCATLVVDFVAAAAEFHEISEKDQRRFKFPEKLCTKSCALNPKEAFQLRLFKENYCDVALLTMLYNSWLRNVRDGLVFPHGFHFSPTENNQEEMNVFLKRLIDFMQHEIAPIFDKIQLTAPEYTLLKMVAFFNHCVLLTDKSVEIVTRARNKYSKMLVEYINDQFKFWPDEWRAKRIQDLFEIIRLLKIGSVYDTEYCTKLVALNIGNLRRNLPFDIHIRSI